MILASAQTRPHRWDIDKNLNDHYKMVEIAAKNGANLIVFPEMSITGYEREEASKLTFTENDKRLHMLSKQASTNKIIIIAGAPVMLKNSMYIGEFVFFPDGNVLVYTKQFLHPGEELFFKASFDYNPIIEFGKEKISLAICADIDHPQHPENANKINSTIYIPSIFFSKNGIQNAHDLLGNYSSKYGMNVLMSNFAGFSWETEAGGQSAFWNNEGQLIEKMDNSSAGLLLVEKKDEIWKAKTIKTE